MPFLRHQELFSWLGSRPALFWSRVSASWIATSHAVVSEILQDPRFVRRPPSLDYHPGTAAQMLVVFMEGGRQQRARSSFLAHYASQTLGGAFQYEECARAVLSGLGDQPIDVTEFIATSYLATVQREILGISAQTLSCLLTHCVSLDSLFSVVEPSAKETTRGLRALDDILATIMRDSSAEPISKSNIEALEAAYSMILFLYGSHATLIRLIGNILYCLVEFPDSAANLIGGKQTYRDLEQLTDEVIRFLGPTYLVPRIAVEDVKIGSTIIRKGERVLCMTVMANRDPEVFLNPHAFDPGRSNAESNVSFGAGRHRCPSIKFAKNVATGIVSILLEHWHSLSIDTSRTGWTESINGYGATGISISRR